MTEHDSELLSALVDGELDKFEAKRVLDQTLDSEAMRARWKHYHMISDVLHGELPLAGNEELPGRIRAAIEAEAVEPAGLVARSGLHLKPVASFALAASVAVVAVLGFRAFNTLEEPAAPTVAQTGPMIMDRVDLAQVSRRQAGVEQRLREKLNSYMVHHAGFAGGRFNGALPYARIVNYDAGR